MTKSSSLLRPLPSDKGDADSAMIAAASRLGVAAMVLSGLGLAFLAFL